MRGSLTKRRDGVYRIRISLGRDDGGHRKYHCEDFHGTRKEAEARQRELVRSYESGGLVGITKMTLNAFLEKWFEEAAGQRLKPRTLEGYRYIVKHNIANTIGRLPLQKITPLVLQSFYNDLTRKRLAAQTVRNVHTVLRGALRQGVRWRLIAHNPAVDVDLPKQHRDEEVVRAMSPQLVLAFLDAAEEDRWGAVLLFALVSGARPCEYLALQWEDLDLKTRTARIEKAIFWPRGGGWRFDSPKTSKSRRTIPLPEEMVERLRLHKARQADERTAAGSRWNTNHNFVFSNSKGGPIYELNLARRNFKSCLSRAQEAKLKQLREQIPALTAEAIEEIYRPFQGDFSLYSLRHTCATLLLLEEVPAKVVSERLGHASVTLTLDTYSHVLPTMQRAATKKLGDVIFGLRSDGAVGHDRYDAPSL